MLIRLMEDGNDDEEPKWANRHEVSHNPAQPPRSTLTADTDWRGRIVAVDPLHSTSN